MLGVRFLDVDFMRIKFECAPTTVHVKRGGVIAIISFRPGGWMQQSAVPRCAILSVGSTGGIGSETPRVHNVAWWCGGVAARGAGAAGRADAAHRRAHQSGC